MTYFSNLKYLISLILGSIFFGLGIIFIKFSSVTDPATISFYRFGASALVFFLYILISKESFLIPSNLNLRLLIASTFLTCDLFAYYLAMNYAPIINVSLIANLTPIFVSLISYLFLNHKISRNNLIGIVMTTLGLFILVGFDLSPDNIYGNSIAFLAVILYSFYLILMSDATKRLAGFKINFYVSLYCSIFLLALAKYKGIDMFDLTKSQAGYLITNSFLAQILGQTLVLYGLKSFDPKIGALILLLDPITVIVSSYFFFDQTLTYFQIFGVFIVLFGILVAKR